jgi:5-methylcytosine-specific restriction endonuclease McrA
MRNSTFSAEARLKGQEAARIANLGSTANVKYKSPEERLYGTWSTCNFKRKGFTLTFEQSKILMHSDCFYCGRVPSQQIDSGRTKIWSSFRYQGIDRIDNAGIYEINNCVPCCGTCNSMKSDLTQDEFLKQVKNIFEFKNKINACKV